VKNRSDQDPLNFPIRLNNIIGALARSVMAGDAAPTAQAYEVEKDLAGRLEVQQKAFDQLVKDDLAKLSAALVAKQQKAIVVAVLPDPS